MNDISEGNALGNSMSEAYDYMSLSDEDLYGTSSVEGYLNVMQDIRKYATELDVSLLCYYLQCSLHPLKSCVLAVNESDQIFGIHISLVIPLTCCLVMKQYIHPNNILPDRTIERKVLPINNEGAAAAMDDMSTESHFSLSNSW